MNPKDFGWTEDQQVTVTNPTSEDFNFKVHGKDYMLAAGKTAKMPGFIAWLYVYGQASKVVQTEGKFARWNEEGFRKKYYDKFVVGVDELIQIVEDESDTGTHTFDEDEDDEIPAPGTGMNYTPKAKRGRPSRV